MLEMLEELDRTDTLPTLHAIDVLLVLGRSDAAEAKINRLLSRNRRDPMARVAQAELLIRGGQLLPAAKLLEQVVAEDPVGAAARRAVAVAARTQAQMDA